MSILSKLFFGLRWMFYIFQSIRYQHFRFMVFLSRPFAPHCLSSFCFGMVMVTHYYTSGWPPVSFDAPFLENAENLFIWLQYAESKNLWKIIDVPLLMIGLFCQIPQIVFRRYTAMRGTMKKPLRPLLKVKPPKEKAVMVSARLVMRAPKPKSKAEPYQMPPRVAALLQQITAV